MLGALEKLLDVNFAPDIDIGNINLINIDKADRFRKDGRTLEVNLHELDPEEREEVLKLPQSQFEEKGRVLRADEEEDAQAIEDGYGEDKEEILDYFDGVLSDQYHSILDASLHLRALIEQKDLTKEQIREKKRDIAKRHGPDAVYLSSLTTAGYFDPDGGLRDLYVKMGLNKNYDKYNFHQELENLVDKRLLCVFVESDDEVSEVTQEVRDTLARYQREDPIHEWVDIRGIGTNCEDIMDLTISNLEDEFIGIDYDRWTDDEDLSIRIHPHSLPQIVR